MKNLWKFRDESGKDQGSGSNERQFGNSSSIIWIVLIFLIGFWIWNLFGSTTEQTEIAYTTFREQVRNGNVSEVTVSGEEIRARWKNLLRHPSRPLAASARFNIPISSRTCPLLETDSSLISLRRTRSKLRRDPNRIFLFLP